LAHAIVAQAELPPASGARRTDHGFPPRVRPPARSSPLPATLDLAILPGTPMGMVWLWMLMLLGARGKNRNKQVQIVAHPTGLVFHSHSEGPTAQAQVPNDLLAWIPQVNDTAVVRPFWYEELLPLVTAEQQSVGCKIHACPADAKYRLPVDLVLYYAGSGKDIVEGQTAAALLDTLARLLASRGCFRAVGVGFANLPRWAKYPLAPCAQFLGMVGTRPRPFWGYRAVFQMERDVTAVRDGWLLGLLPHLARAARKEAWVIGGSYTPGCQVNVTNAQQRRQQNMTEGMWVLIAAHINGNAIYSADPEYARWAGHYSCRKKYWEGIKAGYDFEMYSLADRAGTSYKFVGVPEIANCKPVGIDRQQWRTMEAHVAAESYPSLLLVHSDLSTPTAICP